MTDRAVQPEAPIFEVTEEQAREIVDEWVRLYGTRHPDGSISFPRAASQERPQPPLHGHQSGGDWYECTDEHRGVAQERPQPDPIDVDLMADAILSLHRQREGTLAEGWPPSAKAIATEYARLSRPTDGEPE
jgi:hypothetical protein